MRVHQVTGVPTELSTLRRQSSDSALSCFKGTAGTSGNGFLDA